MYPAIEKLICARCGSAYERKMISENAKINGFSVSRIRYGNDQTHVQNLEICPSCAESFVNWFKMI